MKAIMYHYVRDYNSDLPYFRFLDISNFRKQLDFFEDEFGFLTKDEWMDFVFGNSCQNNFPNKGVVLTFDDAMSCQWTHVYDELKRRQLWGIFYVPTRPYTEEKMLDVHRTHMLCGKYEGKKLLNICSNLINEEMIPFSKIKEFRESYDDQSNYKGVSEFKRILNYFIKEELVSELIDEISNYLNFKDYSPSFYVSERNLKKMSENDMIIGSHTVNHRLMSKLSKSEQEKEISDSFAYLQAVCNITHKTYMP